MPWKPSDSEDRITAALDDDAEQWRVNKLMKKDEYGRLMGRMRENWLYLFSLHKYLAC